MKKNKKKFRPSVVSCRLREGPLHYNNKIDQTMKSPKFKIGQKVTHKPDLYQQTESEVVEITRCFWNGDKYSRAYLERDLKNLRDDIEWEIIDNTLIIYPYMSSEWSCKAGKFIPAMTQKREIPFHHHGYTVENSKMRTLFPERSLKLKK